MRNSVILLLLIAVISCQPKKESFLSKVQLTDLKGETLDSEQFSNKVVILNLEREFARPCVLLNLFNDFLKLLKTLSRLIKGVCTFLNFFFSK